MGKLGGVFLVHHPEGVNLFSFSLWFEFCYRLGLNRNNLQAFYYFKMSAVIAQHGEVVTQAGGSNQ